MRKASALLAVFALGGAVSAQQSAGFKLEEHDFNIAGHPEAGTVLTSTSFRVTLDAIDDLGSAQLTAASFGVGSGFVAGYPPPDEVAALRFPDRQTLEWDAEPSAGSYNLYRDLLSNLLGLGYGNCVQQNLGSTSATDNDPVPAADGFFYLVTVENRLAEEGTKGSRSTGMERTGTACP